MGKTYWGKQICGTCRKSPKIGRPWGKLSVSQGQGSCFLVCRPLEQARQQLRHRSMGFLKHAGIWRTLFIPFVVSQMPAQCKNLAEAINCLLKEVFTGWPKEKIQQESRNGRSASTQNALGREGEFGDGGVRSSPQEFTHIFV